MMNRMTFNLNEWIYVKLNDDGRRILREKREQFNKKFPRANLGPYVERETDERGFVGFQGWDLMQTFGPHMNLGGNQPFSLYVEIESDALQPVEAEKEKV